VHGEHGWQLSLHFSFRVRSPRTTPLPPLPRPQLERGKLSLQQYAEVRGVTARYRGPLLESAIDLEQRLWHLVTEWPLQRRTSQDYAEEIRYLLFTLAQVLGGGVGGGAGEARALHSTCGVSYKQPPRPSLPANQPCCCLANRPALLSS
jgi:hypothetical protein